MTRVTPLALYCGVAYQHQAGRCGWLTQVSLAS